MTIYKFPEENKEKHNPEYVVIDEIEGGPFEHNETISSFNRLKEIPAPFGLRLFFLLSSILLAFLTLLLFSFTLLFSLLSFAFFKKWQSLNELSSKLYRGFEKAGVFFLGMFIATFSPPFGIGIVILYFFLKGEALESDFLNNLTAETFIRR